MIVVAMCVYNEKAFIYHALSSIVGTIDSITDMSIRHIDILDGAWDDYKKRCPLSDDGTEGEVQRFDETVRSVSKIPITFRKNKFARNDSDKRNQQLEYLAKKYPDDWILVIDADEQIFSTHRRTMWDRNLAGYVDVWGDDRQTRTESVRLFPADKKFHYHTEQSMCIHDDQCNLVMDYNPARGIGGVKLQYVPGFYIINHSQWRSMSRITERHEWVRNNGLALAKSDCQYASIYPQSKPIA